MTVRYSAEHWLECADEARLVANTMRNLAARHMMLEIAAEYEKLARQATSPARAMGRRWPARAVA